MNLDTLFSLSTLLVLPVWLLLMFAPNWSWTTKVAQHIWIPALLALLYVYLSVTKSPRPEGADLSSLEGLLLIYTRPDAALISWLHFLTLDLFVGAWIVRDSISQKIHPVLVAPCLFLTSGFGPAGLLLYFLIRLVLRKKTAFSFDD